MASVGHRTSTGLHCQAQFVATGRIPDTHPEDTSSLWKKVRDRVSEANMSGRRQNSRSPKDSAHAGRKQELSREDTIEPPLPPSASASQTGSSTSTLLTKDTTISRRSKATITPRDPDFREDVLEPRGIVIKGDTISLPDPYKHFASDRTSDTNYKELQGLESVGIWLEKDDTTVYEISEEYHCMAQNNLCEAEFATFGKEKILKGEPRRFKVPEDGLWRTERMIEPVAKPSARERWSAPPRLASWAEGRSYNFDLRPDCSYWLSLRAFNKDWRDKVEEFTFVMYERVTCPYFTIEFKRDDSGDVAAENQVASAGALALYNRYLLRAMCLDQSKMPWRKEDMVDLRHYGATFGGSKYALWCLEPILSEKGYWNGCTMSRIFRGGCHTESGVKSLFQWVNEIHAWGLQKYGPACHTDIKRCLRHAGFRTSEVGSAA